MNQRCLRILVADDDPTVALLMQAALSGPAFAVSTVNNGAAAWDAFNRSTFDMVLLDVEMPEMDGFEVCTAIRESPGHALPVILVTGRCDAEFLERARSLDAGYLAKPLNWSALAGQLMDILNGPVR